jgi:L-lysine 2,3-aminomutase
MGRTINNIVITDTLSITTALNPALSEALSKQERTITIQQIINTAKEIPSNISSAIGLVLC